MGRRRTYERDDVLDKAMALFWQKGFLATSMAEMTEATGLNTASMYKEFGDKDGLFEGALARYRGTVMSPRFAILKDRPDLGGVMAFLDSVASGAAGPEYKGCLMMNHLAQKHAVSPTAAAMIDDFCAAMEGLIEAALRNAQGSGDLPAGRDPALMASAVMCWVHGLVLYGRHPGRKKQIKKLRDTIGRTLLA